MKMIFAAAALAAAAVAAPAMAQPMMGPVSGYANLGYAYAHEDPVNLSAVQGRLGVRGSYFGVEGQGAFGIGSDTDSGVKVKLRNEFSGYAVGFLPVHDSGLELFARIGYGHTSIALLDALKTLSIPVIECHLSNPAAREEFRRHTFVSLAATGIVSGFGAASYELAIEAAFGLIRV